VAEDAADARRIADDLTSHTEWYMYVELHEASVEFCMALDGIPHLQHIAPYMFMPTDRRRYYAISKEQESPYWMPAKERFEVERLSNEDVIAAINGHLYHDGKKVTRIIGPFEKQHDVRPLRRSGFRLVGPKR
jgi:hypothetical protein